MRRIFLTLVATVVVGSGFVRAAELELDFGARVQPMPLFDGEEPIALFAARMAIKTKATSRSMCKSRQKISLDKLNYALKAQSSYDFQPA